jgi:phospholipase C
MRISRREMLAGMGAAALVSGCSGGGGGDPPDPITPADAGGSTPDAARQYSPAELMAGIDHIVVLMMENRSYDHVLGSRRLLEGLPGDGLTGNEWNPGPDGSPVYVHQLYDFTPSDPPHNWDASHAQWDGGKNDGFVIAHAGADQDEVMGYHVREQLPVTYALADGGAVCDRWFSSLLGMTWPNRYYLHCANANGEKENLPAPKPLTSIFDVLSDAGVSNLNYYADVPWASAAYLKLDGLAQIEQYLADAAAGTLPAFSIVDPQFFGVGACDDHPSHDIRLGQAFISTIFNALAQSPLWPRSLFLLVYDEHGGFYDHVAPPTTVDDTPGFEQLGFRVPAIVAGPHVRRGVLSTTLEHVSVISTLTRKYGLAPINQRVTAAADLSCAIDPDLLKSPRRALSLPATRISLSSLAAAPAPPESIHEEMREVPRHLDRRAEGFDITRRILEAGVRLGAVELTD